MKKIICCTLIFALTLSLCSCALLEGKVAELNGDLTGNSYNCQFYSNDGQNFMNMTGRKINISSNKVRERTYVDGTWGYTETLSSVITITIDGNQVENCGSSVIFAESGLDADVNFQYEDIASIESTADGFGDNTLIAGVVNRYKNAYGKPVVVVIQSQLGNPICAYSGEKVYWEVCEDLPKTTMLTIDGKLLYIHRANFQIIDKGLL